MNVLDLFCGAAGGWSLGLEWSGMHTVAACEMDDWRRSVFAANHPGCRMYADVRELTAERIHADLGFLPDAVVGSPPCQEISAANCKGTGITDDHLFWDWARLVFEIRPLWCAAENSPRTRTEGIDGILDALAEAGYAFWPCVVGADNAGANHRRKRLWLIAADAERFELWQQPGRGSGPDRARAAIAREHDPDTDGRLSGIARRHADGCIGVVAREDGDDPQHAQVVEGLRFGGVLGRSGDESAQAGLHDDLDANCGSEGQVGILRQGPDAERAGAYCNTASERCREGRAQSGESGIARNDGEELPPALRDIGLAWPDWNGGIAGLTAACAAAGFGALDDGAITVMAPGLRNRAIAALGDAVVPQIPEIIGRAIMRAA